MAARSLASLTLSFGLVNVPVKLYSATETKDAIRFNLLAPDGARVKQQYVSATTGKVVERSAMKKGYEFEQDRFVVFTSEELKAFDEAASHVIDIVAFVPEATVDPLYYDKAYFLAPDKRGGKPYALLKAAMRESGRCALARWVMKGKQYVAQVRAAEDGLVLQQLLYADEVRSLKELDIEDAPVSKSELALALQLIGSISREAYDPAEFQDEEKVRLLAAIDRKIAGKDVVESARPDAPASGGQVIDLMEALRASLAHRPGKAASKPAARSADVVPAGALKDRKPARRASKADDAAAVPVKLRARK
ncbi:Ku protein [Aquincola sp. MAHUQ-54]|uniref:Non-homologous end joining protein Ku n=1 Tax=Aquincola agrisoli TaxID=3119538 RepID=A0AAW9QJN5_9BURK